MHTVKKRHYGSQITIFSPKERWGPYESWQAYQGNFVLVAVQLNLPRPNSREKDKGVKVISGEQNRETRAESKWFNAEQWPEDH